jgi:hypothetical protein
MAYADDIEPLSIDLAFWFMGLEDPRYPIDQLGRLSYELAHKFRSLAIMLLLSQGSTGLFLHNLMRAGRAREVYLQRLHAAGIASDHFAACGRCAPLLDAIAAGDLERARRIAQLSPTALLAGEYEDDHHYAQLLHRLIQEPPPEQECESILERFETFLDGQANPRLDIARALVQRDAAAFEDALAALLDEFERRIEQAKERAQLEEPVTLAQREVCVEALALLRLAGLRGLPTASEYRYCPSLARDPLPVPFPPW